MHQTDARHTTKGFLLIMLHAHLPFVRYPEYENFLEENWLYEAMTETYIPLIRGLDDLVNERVPFRLALSLTPSLVEMLRDELLMGRYQRYLDRLIELSRKELHRTRKDIRLRDLAKMYYERFLRTRHLFENVYRRDLISAFAGLMGSGGLEIATSAATHAYLPALMAEPAAAKAQIQLAVSHFRKVFGRRPAGIWLPECGFTPEIDRLLREADLGYFFLESHGVIDSSPRSRKNIYSPVKTPCGVTIFARDSVSSRQVWSAQEGYPGDAAYREFYRDIGFDLDADYLSHYLPDGLRAFTGIKYFRITNKASEKKRPYNRAKALRRAEIHAKDFLKSREAQILSLNRKLKTRPLITAAFDAELFGHWWFEGPEWLIHLLRAGPQKETTVRFVTPSEYIAENPASEVFSPSLSSWGQRGYSSTWIDRSNSWLYRHVHTAAKRMREMAVKNIRARGVVKRALNQAARELLLAQTSDWAFMLQKGKASEFATRKFEEHITNFFTFHQEITAGRINVERLALLEQKDNIFSDIDFRIYAV